MNLIIFVAVLQAIVSCDESRDSSHPSVPPVDSEQCRSFLDSLEGVASDGQIDRNENAHWKERLPQSSQIFQDIIRHRNWQCFEEILASVGTNPESLDFLIVFGAMHFTLPIYSEFERWDIPPSVDIQMSSDEYHDSRLAAARILAEQFATGTAAWRARYYHALLWSNLVRIHTGAGFDKYVDDTKRGFDEANGDEIWWYVRNAIVLMYATGELPEYETLTPTVVHAAFDEWEARLKSDYDKLLPSPDGLYWQRGTTVSRLFREEELDGAQDAPFPDWSGPVPPVRTVDRHFNYSLF